MNFRKWGMCAVLAMGVFNAQAETKINGSTILSVLSGALVTSPVWVPFWGSKRSIDYSADQKEAKNRQQERDNKAKEAQNKLKQATIPADAVAVDVVDRYGDPRTLYLPESVLEQVAIKKGDHVDLETDANGVMLYKDGKGVHYFVLPEKAHQFEQKNLQVK